MESFKGSTKKWVREPSPDPKVVREIILPVHCLRKSVQRVVGELIPTVETLIALLPLLHANVAVVAGGGSVARIGIVQPLLKGRGTKAVQPAMHVVLTSILPPSQ